MPDSDVPPVRIVLKDGPVTIRSLGGAGVSAGFDLWDDIVASEFFPAAADSAFYVLTLEKKATAATEIWKVERDLVRALELLAATWPFSGGTYLAFDTRTLVLAPQYQSNAEQVEAALLAGQGLRPVASSLTLSYDIVGRYVRAPLEIAACLGKAMNADYALKQLLLYYHEAQARTQSWFIPLYKVRDSIKSIYGGEHEARRQLGLGEKDWYDWRDFGGLLNRGTDLRHAEIGGPPRPLAKQEIDRLYQLAHAWIHAHLVKRGLPVALP